MCVFCVCVRACAGQKDRIIAGFHYDLNFITIHGKSRYPGLFVWTRDGQKKQVRVPDGCLLIQVGGVVCLCVCAVLGAKFRGLRGEVGVGDALFFAWRGMCAHCAASICVIVSLVWMEVVLHPYSSTYTLRILQCAYARKRSLPSRPSNTTHVLLGLVISPGRETTGVPHGRTCPGRLS